MWKSLKQPAVTRWLKDIKDTLQQIKCNSRGKTKQIANFICAPGLFEGITGQLWGCSAQLVVSSLAEVDVYTLCLQSFFHFFVEMMRETLALWTFCSKSKLLLSEAKQHFHSRTSLSRYTTVCWNSSYWLISSSSLFSFSTLNLVFITSGGKTAFLTRLSKFTQCSSDRWYWTRFGLAS